jgi:hypothetical protein
VIHHIAIEVPANLQSEEIQFWNVIGFAETALPQRGKRGTRWLIDGESAIEMHLVNPRPEFAEEVHDINGAGHTAVIRPDFERTLNLLAIAGLSSPERAADYHGWKRAFIQSPAGYMVELLEGAPSIKAGRPLEKGEMV